MRDILADSRWAILPVVAAFLFLPQLLLARLAGDSGEQAELAALPPGFLMLVVGTGIAGLVGQLFVSQLALRVGGGRTVGDLLARSVALL
ncbi:MAG: hypothetical protein SNJ63_10560, partial [Sphingomonadaceae bacterium]